tara:strand:+ start:353 stop:988 length:636 start_codon:yes stop_codon:yes gene_type:complete
MNPTFFYQNSQIKLSNVNTYIGNMGATINTVPLLATYLGVKQYRISKFKLTGLDIECAISGNEKYTLVGVSGSAITFFLDNDGRVGNIGNQVFRAHTNNITNAYFPAIINQTNSSIFQDSRFPNILNLPNVVSLPNSFFGNCSVIQSSILNIPKCLNVGSTQGLDILIRLASGSSLFTINANTALQTSNAGGVEGDIADAIARGVTVNYIP